MDASDKRLLVRSASVVLVIVVFFNVYRGITVSKIGVPGILEIEFNTGDDKSASEERSSVTYDRDGFMPILQTPEKAEIRNETAQAPRERAVSADPSPKSVERVEQPLRREAALLNVSGTWYGDDGSLYEINQTGNSISFFEFGIFGVTASGYGTISGSRLEIDYETVFGTVGKATLNLSDDKSVLRGSANDYTSGAVTQLTLRKE